MHAVTVGVSAAQLYENGIWIRARFLAFRFVFPGQAPVRDGANVRAKGDWVEKEGAAEFKDLFVGYIDAPIDVRQLHRRQGRGKGRVGYVYF